MYHCALGFTDANTYERGIRILRDVALSGRERDTHFGMAGAAPGQREAVQIALEAPLTPGAQIVARIRTADLYLTSVHNGRVGFYFRDHSPGRPTRTQEQQVMLGFESHYRDLGSFASLGAVTTGRIDAAITAISRWITAPPSREVRGDGSMVQSEHARHLLLLCLILSEAARFHRVFLTMRNALSGKADDPLDLRQIDRLTRDWDRLSRAGDRAEIALPSETR